MTSSLAIVTELFSVSKSTYGDSDSTRKEKFDDVLFGCPTMTIAKLAAYFDDHRDALMEMVRVSIQAEADVFAKRRKDRIEAAKPDYIVLYQSQVARYLYPAIVDEYYLNGKIKPEFIVKINGIEYAWVYKNEKSASYSPK